MANLPSELVDYALAVKSPHVQAQHTFDSFIAKKRTDMKYLSEKI